MGKLENLEIGNKKLYSDGYFSDNYNQELFLKRANFDSSNIPKYYLLIFSKSNQTQILQGFIYFYLDSKTKTSNFIGMHVEPEYRNLNIGSFLMASWIDLCFNNGYDFLGTNKKQRKPFLLYMLKTYGFDILDKSLYDTRTDVISICRNVDLSDQRKYLLFKDSKHEKVFMGTNIYQSDNYEIVHNIDDIIILDKIILPLQSMKRNHLEYNLSNYELAKTKTRTIISRHQKN